MATKSPTQTTPTPDTEICITCHHTQLVDSKYRQHFAQTHLNLTEDHLGFGEEVDNLLRYLRSALYALAYTDLMYENDEEAKDLAKLCLEVLEEAQRRKDLYDNAVEIWQHRAEAKLSKAAV